MFLEIIFYLCLGSLIILPMLLPLIFWCYYCQLEIFGYIEDEKKSTIKYDFSKCKGIKNESDAIT